MCVLRSDHKLPLGKAVSILPPRTSPSILPPVRPTFVRKYAGVSKYLSVITSCVCRQMGVEDDEIRSNQRRVACVLAREMIVSLARKHTNASYPEIARYMGRPTHTTCIMAYQRLQGDMAKPEEEQRVVNIGGEEMRVPELYERIECLVLSRLEEPQ